MSLPPEHISVKRRRQEEPVDLLYLENERHQTKRRFTDYCFQRVKADANASTPPGLPSRNGARQDHRAVSSHAVSGIPIVRATSPGAESRDEAERRNAQKVLRDNYSPWQKLSTPVEPVRSGLQETSPDNKGSQRTWSVATLRRFHLYHGSRAGHSKCSSGIKKRKATQSNHLATFVERSHLSREASQLVDKVAKRQSDSGLRGGTIKSTTDCQTVEGNVCPVPERLRRAGQSMHDHPSTWDQDSDQLADELAAFALEISQNEKHARQASAPAKAYCADIDDTHVVMDEDFIYDTYIRVPISDGKDGDEPSNDVGLLVIGDDDQELWQTYVESDDDSEWDEEDPDSNAEDNPANEYPDEEFDSEDEYGYGAYRDRKLASDDEEYDLNDSWSNSER